MPKKDWELTRSLNKTLVRRPGADNLAKEFEIHIGNLALLCAEASRREDAGESKIRVVSNSLKKGKPKGP